MIQPKEFQQILAIRPILSVVIYPLIDYQLPFIRVSDGMCQCERRCVRGRQKRKSCLSLFIYLNIYSLIADSILNRPESIVNNCQYISFVHSSVKRGCASVREDVLGDGRRGRNFLSLSDSIYLFIHPNIIYPSLFVCLLRLSDLETQTINY